MRSWCVMIRKLSCVWRPRSNHSSWIASEYKITVLSFDWFIDDLQIYEMRPFTLLAGPPPGWSSDVALEFTLIDWLIDWLTVRMSILTSLPRSNFLHLSISICHIYAVFIHISYIYHFAISLFSGSAECIWANLYFAVILFGYGPTVGHFPFRYGCLLS